MAKFADYFSDASDRYKTFRPDYPPEFFEYLAQLAPDNQVAIDVGCGNGQASVAIAKHFHQVIATDASDAQIAEAAHRDNISYTVSPAEVIAVPSASADIVTVAQAIHWFDHSRFFSEVDRVLKPGGIIAAWGYQLLYTDKTLDAVVADFHSKTVGAFWPKGRELLDEGYTKIHFPYPREDTPAFKMEKQWRFGDLMGYLGTWSAVKQYQKANGSNPLETHFTDFLAAWGDPDAAKNIYWPLILYIGRKPEG